MSKAKTFECSTGEYFRYTDAMELLEWLHTQKTTPASTDAGRQVQAVAYIQHRRIKGGG